MYIDAIFALNGYFFSFFLYPYLLLSWMFGHDWTHLLWVSIYACVLYFCICTCSARLNMFHMERRSRNTLIIFAVATSSLKPVTY